MAQSKRNKQQNALTNLLTQLEQEQTQRANLQCQYYGLIAPNENELRLSSEIYSLRVKLGILPNIESIF